MNTVTKKNIVKWMAIAVLVLLASLLIWIVVHLDCDVDVGEYKKEEYNKAEWANKKIKIIALCTPNYIPVGGEGVKKLREYSDKHGYDFKLYEKRLLPEDVHVNFNKMQMLADETKDTGVDYTILSDVDIDIKDWGIKMENIIESIPAGKLIAMPADENCIKITDSMFLKMGHYSKYNAGFIVAKNGPETSRIFEDWVRKARGECEHMTHSLAPNQKVFDNCVLPKYKDKIFKIPYQLNGVGCSAGFRQYIGTSKITNGTKMDKKDKVKGKNKKMRTLKSKNLK